MPKRLRCAGVEHDQINTIYVYLKLSNRSVYIRIDGLDWLLSYVDDRQHFQGIVRDEPQSMHGTAVAEYRFEKDFNAKGWEGTVQVGEATVQSTWSSPDMLCNGLWEKLEANYVLGPRLS